MSSDAPVTLQAEIDRLRTELAEARGQLAEHERQADTHRQSQALLRAIFDGLPFSFWAMDADHRLVMQNQRTTQQWGLQLGKRIQDMELPPALVTEFEQRKTRVFAGETLQFDEILPTPQGERHYHTIVAPVWLDGAVVAMVGINVDMTDHIRMEQAACRYRITLATILESIPQAVFWKDREGVYLGCNTIFARGAGYDDPQALVGKTDLDLWPRADADCYRADDRAVVESGQPKRHIIEPLQTADGQRLWLDTSKVPLMDVTGAIIGVLGVFEDITERKCAEDALRANEEDLAITLRSIGDAVITTDAQGMVTRLNPMAEHLTGWMQSEARGLPLIDIFVISNAETHQPVDNPVERVLRSGQVVGLANHTVLKARNGNEYQIADSAAPIRDDNGVIRGVVLVFRNVTEQYHLEDQLRQAQKMETVGRLAGGVAHDFNNLLSGILGYAELLERRITDERARQHARAITEAANRAADLTRQLLVFSRKSARSSVPIDIHGLIGAVVGILEHTFDRRITIARQLHAPEPVVAGDAAQLQSALLNLAINARDAMPYGGTLGITTDEVVLDHPQVLGQIQELAPGRYVCITVTDTGTGMSAEVMDHIFEPFFTTKPTGVGTGLGLAAVYGIVRDHHGRIAVASTPGVGTTFTIHLPCVVDAVPASTPTTPSVGSGRILLVDDEPLLRALGTEQLMALGYDVVCARDGQEAIDIIRTSTMPFHAVILDVIMPRLGGGEALSQIRILAPNLPVVMASGFGADQEQLLRDGAVAFVPKPFTATIMSQVLSKVLGNG